MSPEGIEWIKAFNSLSDRRSEITEEQGKAEAKRLSDWSQKLPPEDQQWILNELEREGARVEKEAKEAMARRAAERKRHASILLDVVICLWCLRALVHIHWGF